MYRLYIRVQYTVALPTVYTNVERARVEAVHEFITAHCGLWTDCLGASLGVSGLYSLLGRGPVSARPLAPHIVAKSVTGGHLAASRGIAVLLVRWRLRRPGLIAEAAQPMYTFDLVPKKRVVPLRPGCCSSPESSSSRGPRTRSGTRDKRPPGAAGG